MTHSALADPNHLALVGGYQHYLRGERPNLAAGQNPELIVISCADSRVQPQKIFDFAPGKAFEQSNIGAFVQPKEFKDPSLDAFLNYPLNNFSNLKAVMILGHTHCGGVKGLVNAVLKEAKAGSNDINNWVVPLAHEPLIKAIKDAQAKGVPEAEIVRVMEYVMPLLSSQRLMERELTIDGKQVPVGELMKAKGINILPAVYDLDTRTVQMFDKNTLQYRPLEEMQQEVLTPKNPPSPEAPLGQSQDQPKGDVIKLPETKKPATFAELLNAPKGELIRIATREDKQKPGVPQEPRNPDSKAEPNRMPPPDNKDRERKTGTPAFGSSTVEMGQVIPMQALQKGVQVGINEISRLQSGAQMARA